MTGNVSSHYTKRIYFFSAGRAEGNKDMRQLLGGKGANLAEMTSIGLPVPPGFTITASTCAEYYDSGNRFPSGLFDDVKANMKRLEMETGKEFGSSTNPLLVSVRSGAAVSMPGMMDTVLNLGLTDQSVTGLADLTHNERFALDAYRRLINMFGNVVMEIDHEHFEAALAKIKKRFKAVEDTELDETALIKLIDSYKAIYKKHTGETFPQDPYQQLHKAIEAVFMSWNTPRAIAYRKINNIRGLAGTGVNIQTMVFGNMGDDSGS